LIVMLSSAEMGCLDDGPQAGAPGNTTEDNTKL